MRAFDSIHDSLSGSLLIEANAGTGKTYTLTTIYLRLIIEQYLLPEQILVVTFTKAATQELKDRLKKRLNDCLQWFIENEYDASLSDHPEKEILSQTTDVEECRRHIELALLSFDQCSIFTINGFCEALLKRYAQHSNLPPMLELTADQDMLIKERVYDYWRKYAIQLDPWLLHYLVSLGVYPQSKSTGDINQLTRRSLISATTQQPFDEPLISQRHILDLLSSIQSEWFNYRLELIDTLQNRHYFHGRAIISKRPERCIEALDTFIDKGIWNNDIEKLTTLEMNKLLLKKATEVYSIPTFHDDLQTLIGLLKQFKNYTAYQCAQETKKNLSLFKQKNGLYSYDDQILYIWQLLRSDKIMSEQLRQQYPAILVDEFQDTDIRQYEIFQCIHHRSPEHLLVLVGDPKQSIYRFRGADVFVYQEVKKQVDMCYQLNTNWRSSDGLVEAINVFYQQQQAINDEPFILPWINYHNSKASDKEQEKLHDTLINEPVVYWQQKEATENNWLVNEIRRLLDGTVMLGRRKVSPADITILVDTNKQAVSYYELLLQQDIPSVLWTNKSIFSTAMARAYYYLLHSLVSANPSRIKALYLSDLMNQPVAEVAFANVDMLIQPFVRYRSMLETQGLIAVMNRFYADFYIDQNLLKGIDGERLTTDRQHMHDLISMQFYKGLNIDRILQWLAVNMEHPDDHDELQQRRLESDKNSLSIMTIHKAKGLEFPIVFLPELHNMKSKSSYPFSVHYQGKPVLIWQAEEAIIQQQLLEENSEQLRLLYVALTRAAQRLYLINALPKGKPASKSHVVSERLYDVMNSESMAPYVFTKQPLIVNVDQTNDSNRVKKNKFYLNQLKRNLALPKQMYSYSQINQPHKHLEFYSQVNDDNQTSDRNIFTFDKGSLAGSCLHEILEYWQFDQSDDVNQQLIEQKLAHYSLDESWSDVLLMHLKRCLSQSLTKYKFTLEKIDKRLKEMDFIYPFFHISHKQVNQWLGQHRGQSVNDLRHSDMHGFMNGSIDLFFQHDDRYFIADYKSNYLGDSCSCYDMKSMEAAISEHNYDLQYLLYTVAAIKHIRRFLPDFSYEKNFGGVIYLFIRGMEPNSQNGVYHCVPEQSLIESMLELC